MRKNTILMIAAVLVVSLAVGYTQLSLFVVQPIGAVPEGKTLVITRLANSKFIASADAMCVRIQGGVNLICRAAALGAVAENATIVMRLPYSELLYSISTDGKHFSR